MAIRTRHCGVEKHAVSLSRVLRLALRLHAPDPYPEHLRSALGSRAIVDAAVSLIRVQNRCSHETAIRLLHLASRHSNKRLHAIAEDILKHATAIPVLEPGTDVSDLHG